MKIKKLQKDEYFARFNFEGIKLPLLNALRRYLINHVEVYAIDKIIVYENNTAFFDEYIAHRIGMIPLKATGKIKEEEVGFYLDFQGPGKIYSRDLKSNNERIKVAIEDIPIITLKEGQSLRIEGKVKKGIGRKHAKYQSGIASYSIRESNGKLVSGEMFVETLYHMNVDKLVEKAINNLIRDVEELEKKIAGIEKE